MCSFFVDKGYETRHETKQNGVARAAVVFRIARKAGVAFAPLHTTMARHLVVLCMLALSICFTSADEGLRRRRRGILEIESSAEKFLDSLWATDGITPRNLKKGSSKKSMSSKGMKSSSSSKSKKKKGMKKGMKSSKADMSMSFIYY